MVIGLFLFASVSVADPAEVLTRVRLDLYNGHGYSQSGSAYKQCCNAYSQSGSAYKQCCNAYSQSGSAHKQCCNAYSQSGSAHKQCENGLFAEHPQNFNLFQK